MKKQLWSNDILSKTLSVNVNEDRLYDEVTSAVTVTVRENVGIPNNDPVLQKIVGKLFSIPITNAIVVRIFPLMENLWTDEQNCLKVEMIKAELITKFNFQITSAEINNFLSNSDQQFLLKSVSNNTKWYFKTKCYSRLKNCTIYLWFSFHPKVAALEQPLRIEYFHTE